MLTHMKAGLEGVVAAETELSLVDGERGELIIAGYAIDDLAPNATFEEVVGLLTGAKLDLDSRGRLSSTIGHIEDPMDALRAGMAAMSSDDPATVISAVPVIVAAHARLRAGKEPIDPRADLGHAANYLYMLDGREASPARVRALETYLNTVVDHGLNASTFTARVIASTGSDLVSAITGAIGALKGPLHGGAPGPALDIVFEIGSLDRAEEVLRRKLEAGERLMGFGHRVYKVRDPRADVLAAACERLFADAGADRKLYDLARGVESIALRLLDEYKPGRNLRTNVEFYTALLLHGIGFGVPLFTPTFAVGRVAGWVAHVLEQRRTGRIIRPQSAYVGPQPRRFQTV
jgi:citrate synthase